MNNHTHRGAFENTPPMNPVVTTIVLRNCSNVFMTFAWYADLNEMNNKWWVEDSQFVVDSQRPESDSGGFMVVTNP